MRFAPASIRSILLVLLSTAFADAAVTYDIVYVRAPRYGDNTNTRWPEVFTPIRMEPGSDLMLLHPNGSEEVLFAAGNGAVIDPVLSFDAQWVYFSYFPDMRPSALNGQRYDAPRQGADIYKIHLSTRQVTRLTQQTWEPPSGASPWSTNHLTASSPNTYYLGYGIFNMAPCPLPGGRIMFVSSRDGFLSNKGFTFPNLRLYVMDEDGTNIEQVGHLNIGSALHPTILKDGRVMFSSYEAQGVRDQRNWGLWAIWPDGRRWEPLMSAFTNAAAFHFQTQLGDGRLAVVEYYNLNNNGFGTLLAFDAVKSSAVPPFGDANPNHPSNPPVRRGLWYFQPGHPSHLQPRYKTYPFSPPGLVNLTGFTHGEDEASSRALDGSFAGKVTHPTAAPGNDVLLVYTPGPANNLNRPTTIPFYDGGIYLIPGGAAINDHRQLVLIKNDPQYNEMMPKPVVPYQAIYGIPEPARLPYLPNDGSISPTLPAGAPFGLVGTASLYKRNSLPGVYVPWQPASWNNLDVFNTTQNDANSNWIEQGADAGKYTNADIHAVRILSMEGVAHRSYGPGIGNGGITGFSSHAAAERLRILGEIPVRKPGVVDPDGNPDTSFLARIPADTPFTFQTLDKDGLVLNMAQTWHQVRPGEMRADCGGCHAHSQLPTDFNQTAAGRGAVPVTDLVGRVQLLTKDASGNPAVRTVNQTAVDVEYHRDIKPILQRSCVGCHSKNGTAAAGLVLDDTAIVNGYEGTYRRLADDPNATYGIPPVIPFRAWRQTNASRYIRMFQSRRSLLMWKLMGRRLDGWTNADHPTESVPGDASTLPPGADPNYADIDYTGTVMPPVGSGVPSLTEDEKMLFARWIDLGCPISTEDAVLKPNLGWFVDDLRPVVTVSSPGGRLHAGPLTTLRFGAYDAYSGLDRASLSVIANFVVNGKAPGTELIANFSETSLYVWSLTLTSPINSISGGRLTVRVKDREGNWTSVERTFDVGVATGSPVAANDSYNATEDSPLSIVAPGVLTNDSDPAARPLTATLVTPPAHGSLALSSNGSFTYTPSANFSGSDTFGYKAVSTSDSNVAVVSLTVAPVNDAPTLVSPGNRSVRVGSVLSFTLSASDVDQDPILFSATGLPGGATLTSAGLFSWTPPATQTGTHTVTFTASDPAGETDSETVTITVTASGEGARFSIALSPSTQSTVAGSAVTYTVTLTPFSGFSGSVALAGGGAGATFTPSTVVLNGTAPATAMWTSPTPASALPGTQTLTVTGTSGSLVRSASAAKVILAGTSGGDFTIVVTPSSQIVARGVDAQFQVEIRPLNGFTGTVTLSQRGGGEASSFASSSLAVTGTSPVATTYTSPTAATALIGTRTITITAVSGSLSHAATVTKIVQ